MEYNEDEYLMLSGIQHFRYCRRQWALIHIEQQWAENEHTVVGELMHKRAHDPYLTEKRKEALVTRALPISSRILGISGECDVVEFHESEEGVKLHGHRGLYKIYPIEYKKGKPKESEEDILQLTAQAMCLEEMLQADIAAGYLYYGETRHRNEVVFTEELRNRVQHSFKEMHQYFDRAYTPKVKTGTWCRQCSLQNICMPKLCGNITASAYIEAVLKEEL